MASASVLTEPSVASEQDSRLARMADAIRREVFVPATRRPVTLRHMLVAVAAVLAGTVLGLIRTRRPGAFNTLWAEDGNFLLSDALNHSWLDTLAKPLQGYFVLLPRLVAEFTALFPIDWAPAVMSTSAAGVTAFYAMMVYIASGSHFQSTLPRLMVSVPVVATHVAILAVPNNVATLQFATLYVAFWMLLWVPASRTGRNVAVCLIVLGGLSTILMAALLPLAVLRLVCVRDRWSRILFAAVAIPTLLQALAIITGIAPRGEGLSHSRWDPIWAFMEYALWGLPYGVVGERWLMPPAIGMNVFHGESEPRFNIAEHNALLVLAWVIVISIVVVAARKLTRPAWGLAAVAAVCSFGLFALELMGMGFPNPEYLIPEIYLLGVERYLLAPGLMIVTALTALLRPATGPTGTSPLRGPQLWPIVAYATLLSVVCISNLRVDNSRSMTRPWSEVMTEVRAECATTGTSQVKAWNGGKVWWPPVLIPCKKV